jgi:transposase
MRYSVRGRLTACRWKDWPTMVTEVHHLEGAMLYAGLDVCLASVSVCVVDEAGSIIREAVLGAEPEEVAAYLGGSGGQFTRVGLEAGPTAEWMVAALIAGGLPAVCLESRQVKAALSAMPVKTDRNDARGIAQVVRTGWYKAVHVKSVNSQHARTLLAARKHLVKGLSATEQAIRGLLRPFGLKVGQVTRRAFAERIRELVSARPALAAIMEPLLAARAATIHELSRLHKLLLSLVREDQISRRLMTMPGIGPVTALTFRAAIDDPTRFARSRSVGPYLGLTPRRYQSGEVDRVGHITKVGDGETRTALFEAANVVLRPATRWSPMKAWAVRIARRQGSKRAKVALARKMAVVLHRMWCDGTEFRWTASA